MRLPLYGLLSVVVFATLAFAQPPENHSPSPLIKDTTQLVEITVIATGKNGSPVFGLTRNDFEVSEGGKPQTISAFAQSSTSSSGLVGEKPGGGVFSNGVFSNTVTKQFGSVSVLLVDGLDTSLRQWQLAWPQIVKFVRQLHSQDHVALYLLDRVRGLRVLQDYDDAPEKLIEKFQKLPNPSLSGLLASSNEGEVSGTPSFAHRGNRLTTPVLLSLGSVQGVTNALQIIADHLAGTLGRKSLIWLAAQFPDPFPSTNKTLLEAYRPKLVRALNSLLAADVAIYPVDASELKPDPAFDVENEDIGIHPLLPGEAPHLPMFSDAALSAIELANRSGGEAYFHTNGLTDALKKVILAEQSSYTLGFYANGEPDNRYYPIHVSIKKDGIRLRYRPGYWDLTKPPAGLHPSDLRVALESPFTLSAVQIQARVISHSQNSQELGLAVFIASGDLTVERQKGAGTATLDILFGQKDARGRGFVIPPYRVPVSMTEAGWASHEWFSTKARLALLKKSKTVRIIVRDEGSGHLGSVDIPLDHFSMW